MAQESQPEKSVAGEFVCARCGLPNARLEEPPLETPLGLRAAAAVCRSCWTEWIEWSVRVINEFQLNLATEEGARIYDEQLRQFLGLPDA